MSKNANDRIIQVSGFGVANTSSTQCDYMLVALTYDGRVIMSTGDREWFDVSPNIKEHSIKEHEI